jgi:hypothetical protein
LTHLQSILLFKDSSEAAPQTGEVSGLARPRGSSIGWVAIPIRHGATVSIKLGNELFHHPFQLDMFPGDKNSSILVFVSRKFKAKPVDIGKAVVRIDG